MKSYKNLSSLLLNFHCFPFQKKSEMSTKNNFLEVGMLLIISGDSVLDRRVELELPHHFLSLGGYASVTQRAFRALCSSF